MAHALAIGVQEQLDLAFGEAESHLIVRHAQPLDKLGLGHRPVAVLVKLPEEFRGA